MKLLITIPSNLANLLIKIKHNVYIINCSNGRENDIRDVVKMMNIISINYVSLISKIKKINKNILKIKQFDGKSYFHLLAAQLIHLSFISKLMFWVKIVNLLISTKMLHHIQVFDSSSYNSNSF